MPQATVHVVMVIVEYMVYCFFLEAVMDHVCFSISSCH